MDDYDSCHPWDLLIMKITNGWRSQNKNVDRIELKVRLGAVTVFELSADLSAKKWRLGLFNFFWSN